MNRHKWLPAIIVLLFNALCFSACVIPNHAQKATVSVLYAGSLAAVMENGIGPAFTKATGIGYQGEAQGSLGAAQLIRDRLRSPDVFISADPVVNEKILMGPQNGNLVRWFATVAYSQLVLAYSPHSRFARGFRTRKMASSIGTKSCKLLACALAVATPRLIPRDIARCFSSAWPAATTTSLRSLGCWAVH